MPKSAGQCTVPFAVSACAMAPQNWLNSVRTRAGLVWVTTSAPARIGSTRCMARYTVTDVAWSTLAQPTASAEDVKDAEDAVAEPHPASAEHNSTASAEHSSTASTGPRTWRGDIMLL